MPSKRHIYELVRIISLRQLGNRRLARQRDKQTLQKGSPSLMDVLGDDLWSYPSLEDDSPPRRKRTLQEAPVPDLLETQATSVASECFGETMFCAVFVSDSSNCFFVPLDVVLLFSADSFLLPGRVICTSSLPT